MKLAAAHRRQAGRGARSRLAGSRSRVRKLLQRSNGPLLDVTGVYGVGRRFGARDLRGAFSLATFSPDRLSRA
jgi:hypothetical protein